ncbi:MAG: TIGR04282 family arsenosugar biosynthesis glycosyltransferase [Gammaproteobacteria bacterium]|nr:TIGR04282 family arsenosugar biosynthesis glycosyltransferase [Gammaproteobacteria bacterium]
MNHPRRALIIFAKAPVPGYAKTRLIPELGEQGAADLHKALCLRTIKQSISPVEWDTLLWCAPDQQARFFQDIKKTHGLDLFDQPEGDLGQKMFNAFEQVLEKYDQAVIIGTDCPVMEAARVRQAFAALSDGFAAVINPAEDGGYVLLGLKKSQPIVFKDIKWGGADVYLHTMQHMDEARLSYKELEVLWDVDDADDLKRYLALRSNKPAF